PNRCQRRRIWTPSPVSSTAPFRRRRPSDRRRSYSRGPGSIRHRRPRARRSNSTGAQDPLMEYRDQTLYLEDVALPDIARREGTPCYVYSRAAILERFCAYHRAFGDVPHKVCYAVKANSNLSILKLLADAGAGFDIVSGGELFRVLKTGANAGSVIFSGVGKT